MGSGFWLSVIGASCVVKEILRIEPAPSFAGEAVVCQLVDDLESLVQPALLVIDDLHEVASADALWWLQLYLSRLPSPLRVVPATREDPRLGLHRLRLSGELTELRGPDLRFSLQEPRELLRTAGITLSDEGLALLDERTEGWVAGLRLVVISLSQHPDPERFVTEFSGSERTVAGYLLEEILERRPADVREMLLRTSVLERVSGPLADYLTGGDGSEADLAGTGGRQCVRQLARCGAIVVSLSPPVVRSAPAGVAARCACKCRPTAQAVARWHEQEDDIAEAIRHAHAARDWPLASRLLADHHLDLTLDGRSGSMCQFLSSFPG